ncbi:hypothetical protein WR25_26168 [Diploscapter pachys]|uniref:Uncharacterized protein n=1 Tax=Diploscapter pachys TaxID=2018661 RepID=A0A2A2J6C0_9BILA|nr:hypothetical protein WR25_26168 [Diploscapter pachys]
MKTLIFLILLILEVVADGETNKDKKIFLSKSLNLNPLRKQHTSEISGSIIGAAQTEDNEEEKIRIPRGEDRQEVELLEEVPPKEEDSLDEDSVDEFPLKDKLLRDGPMAVFNAEDGVALRAKRQMG